MDAKDRPWKPDERGLDRIEKAFARFVADVSLEPKRQRRHTRMNKSYGSRHALLGWDEEEIAALDQAVRQVIPGISVTEARKAMANLMQQLFEEQCIREAADPGEEAYAESLAQLLDLSSARSRIADAVAKLYALVTPKNVYIPVEGIILRATTRLRIGQITLETLSDRVVDEICLRIKGGAQNRDLHQLRQSWKGAKCYVVAHVTGDNLEAQAQALDLVREAIYVFNFLLLGPLSSRCASIIGYRPSGTVSILCIEPANNENGSDTWYWRDEMPFAVPVVIDRDQLQYLESVGYERINTAFANQKGEFSRRVARAVTWYGRAVEMANASDAFVAMAIALEILLSDQPDNSPDTTYGSITQKLRDRMAFLIGDTVEERKRISEHIRDLYRKRSGIVHAGGSVDPDDLDLLSSYVRCAVHAVLDKGFTSFEQFRSWEINQRYAGSPPGNADVAP